MWYFKYKNKVRMNKFYYFYQLDRYLQKIQFSSFNHNEANIKEKNQKIPLIIAL